MSSLVIDTERLRLVVPTVEQVLAQIEALSPEHRAQVSEAWLEQLRSSSQSDPWTHGFSIILRGRGIAIGSCGFKGPVDATGIVEIAYQVEAEHRGCGFATEAARAMTAFAFDQADIQRVRAHTLERDNASARILIKCGFESLGKVIDPEDGPVWRWERSR